MKQRINIWQTGVLLASLLLSSQLQAKTTIETSGDIGAIALPAIAWGISQWRDDSEGQTQLYWSLAGTVMSTELLKLSIHERRPDGSDNQSFPSLHTSVAFTAAAYMQQRYDWQTAVPFYLAASYVGWTRVDAKKHYSKDVLAGALIGYVNARFLVEPIHGVNVAAYADGDSFGVGLQMNF